MNSNLNFNLSVVVEDIIPFVHINDYRLRNLGSGESVNVKRCGNKKVKSFVLDSFHPILYIVLRLIVIFRV